jgi:predicted metal-binding membrane protein
MCAPQAPHLHNTPSRSESSTLAALLLASSGVAWLVTAQLTTADMQVGLLTSPLVSSSMDQMTAVDMLPLGSFIGMWAVMMAAMMLPSLWPAARAFDTTRRATKRKLAVTLLFIAGYLLTWSAVGPVAYVALGLLQGILPMGNVATLRGGAILLLIAGAYQFSPFKQACLRKCHAPDGGLTSEKGMRQTGGVAALSGGLVQGMLCLGSSWPLMLVLLLLGMMNLAWMGAIAVLIVLEKGLPVGRRVSQVIGVGLVAIGIILIAAPHPLPALMGPP